MKLKEYLRILAHYDGSDLYLTADLEPKAKFQGKLKAVDKVIMTQEILHEMAYGLMNKEQQEQFEKKPEMNLAIGEEGIGRFRVNIFKQRHKIAMVIRNIKLKDSLCESNRLICHLMQSFLHATLSLFSPLFSLSQPLTAAAR